MTKRDKIYYTYGGYCAYSGTLLEPDWQIDHMFPKQSFVWHQSKELRQKLGVNFESADNINNLVPCQKIINHYKRGFNVEQFREYLSTLHLRLAKLPKNPKTERRKKYKEYMLCVAGYFSITPEKPFNTGFYFEKL